MRTLKHFIVLSETLHFGRASARANISTSALSRNIRQLETELNTTLFDRDNRTVALTAEGLTFQRYARDALQQWEQIRYDLTDPADQLTGEISLFCSVTASHSILVDLLNRFRPAHPGVEIMLQTGDPEHAIERVVALEEELAIAARPESLPPDVLFKPIAESPLVFVAPMQSTDPSTAPFTPEKAADWEDIPMILAAGGIARRRVMPGSASSASPHRSTPKLPATRPLSAWPAWDSALVSCQRSCWTTVRMQAACACWT